MTDDIPMDKDPHYTTKDRKCKSCGEMNTGSDTCSGPCGQCWACNCDCEEMRGPTSLADAMGVDSDSTVELFINDGTTPLWGDVDPEKDFEEMMKRIQTFFRANAGPVFTHERVDRMMVAIADEVEDHRFHHDSPPEMLDLLLHFVANSRGCEEETDR